VRLGILQVDSVRKELQPRFGNYPGMFSDLLCAADPEVVIEVYDAQQGHYPVTIDACDGYLITGSRDSVYDELAWIAPLVDFVRELRQAQIKLAGICFGHQLIAHFFGGKVAPAELGWAVGVHRNEIIRRLPWMLPPLSQLALLASHKDQVVQLPADAELYAASKFCPYAGFTIGEHTLCIQGHPEFCRAYAAQLMQLRRRLLGEATFLAGMASLHLDQHALGKSNISQANIDGADMGGWLINFFRGTPRVSRS